MESRGLPNRIAHFEILEELGSGAMGVVYRARDAMLRRDVALKLIRPEMTEDARTRGRFLRECQAAAAINHPGIATVYEAGQTDDGRLFLAAELIEGESLRQRIARGPLPPAEVIEIGIQLADALAAAHAKSVVHRDIKPANLMLLADGRLKVLDFGLARLLDADASEPRSEDALETATQTRVGVVVGTPAYMSPEQAAGAPVDARTDVFASGSVLYAAVSGREPFLTGSVPETLRRIIAEEPRPLEKIDPSIPQDLRDVIRTALAKDPDRRFASAAEMGAALRALRPGESAGTGLVVPPSRRRGLRLAAGAVLVLALAAAAWGVMQLLRPGLGFASSDRLLIATVDNRTEDEAFDLALRTALEADLQQSRYAAVFDQGQIAQTLGLMRLDPATPIDEALGRDICRFAGVRALLLPRILAVGQAYELQAVLVDPVSGRHVDSVRVTARGREEVLLEAIDELARRVRRLLGESLEAIGDADFPVIQVTTSSWEALQYLSLGNLKWQQGAYRDAAAMFELALQKDPRFAAARGSLGLLEIQFLGEPEAGKTLLAEALADAGDLPERERLMIKALNRQFVEGDLEGALEEYALISELYPDLMQPYNNRGRILDALGRPEEAVEMYEQAAARSPSDSVPLHNLYWLLLNRLYRPADAERVARRMVEMGPSIAAIRHQLAWSLIAQRRFDEALPELQRVLADEPRHPYALPNTAHVLYLRGRAAEAVPLYRRLLEANTDGRLSGSRAGAVRDLALALIDAGRREEADALLAGELDGTLETEAPRTAWDRLDRAQLLALAGRDGEAERMAERALGSGELDAAGRMRLAQTWALLGRSEAAFDEIGRAFAAGYWDRYFPLIIPAFRPLHDDPRFLATVLPGDGGR